MTRAFARTAGPRPWKAAAGHALAATAAASLSGAALAQQTVMTTIPNPPDIDLLDENNVQSDSGYLSFSVPDVSIGGPAGLSHVTSNTTSAGAHGTEASIEDRYRFSGFAPEVPLVSSFVGGIGYPPTSTPYDTTFSFQGVSERFAGNIVQGQAPGATVSGDGGSLTNNGNGTWTYVDKHGISYLIDTYYRIPNFSTYWPVTLVTYPDGSTVRIHFKRSAGTNGYSRIQGVQKSNGFFLKFFYASNAEPTTATRQAWSQYTRIVAGNLADEYCDVAADSCTFSQAWPESPVRAGRPASRSIPSSRRWRSSRGPATPTRSPTKSARAAIRAPAPM
ncbi:MAG TPA: hypothetical protein VEA60_06825 [Allosphingosinicella sp.]|nr:hypothetical protein [Allosphingosinicella sp.]